MSQAEFVKGFDDYSILELEHTVEEAINSTPGPDHWFRAPKGNVLQAMPGEASHLQDKEKWFMGSTSGERDGLEKWFKSSTSGKRDGFYLPKFNEERVSACAKGERAKGYKKICPRDDKPNCSFVDALFQESAAKAGGMTHFVSWSPDCRVDFFVSCIEAWIHSHSPNELQSENVYLWM